MQTGKIVYNADYDIYYDTDNIIYIEKEGYRSYTIPIVKGEAETIIKNLVLYAKPDEDFKVKMMKYDLSPEELEKVRQGIPFDIAQKTESAVPKNETNSNSFSVSWFDDTGCLTTMTITVIPGRPCATGCAYGTGCEWEGNDPRGPTQTRIIVKYSYAFCNNGSQIGGPTPIDVGPPPNGGGGNGTGTPGNTVTPTQNNNNEDADEVITTPVEPGLEGGNQNPCINLKLRLNNANLKPKIQNLKTEAVLDLNYEKGYSFEETSNNQTNYAPNDGNPNSTFVNVVLNEQGTISGFIHTHFDQPDMSPIFTIEDVKTLNGIFQWRQWSGKPLERVSVMLVSRAGVFAMVITDFVKMSSEGNKLHDEAFFDDLKDKFYGDPKNITTDDDAIKQFLSVISNYGVTLFKANSNLTNWERLELDQNTNQINSIPCN